MKYPLSSVMCAANSLGDNSGLSNATLTVLSISLSGILFQNLLLFLSLGASLLLKREKEVSSGIKYQIN
jgi:hypothetical protein